MRTEDGYIIDKCLNGDSSAFGFLVDKYKASVYAFVYSRLGNFHDAEDLSQEVFLRAYRNLRQLKRYDSFLAWLYSIASNLCKDWIRNESRRPETEFAVDDVLSALEINSYREKHEFDSLYDALNSLPEMYSQVIVLHYLGGMNTLEIARFVGASHEAIRKRLSKARSLLKEEMISMMGINFEGQKLKATFTFRIIEAAKRIKIQPAPRISELPWGLSVAMGIFITVMAMNPALNNISSDTVFAGSMISGETKVLKSDELSVDIIKYSQLPSMGIKGKDDGREINLAMADKPSAAPQAEGDTWTRKADMLTARMWLASCEVNGKIYAMGGAIGVNAHTQKVEEYEPVVDKWLRKADMPMPRDTFAAAVVNGKIYAIGGLSMNAVCEISVVEEYDPVKDKWTKKTDMPTARFGLSASTVNGKIYVMGGSLCGGIALQTVEEYDPVNDTWTKKADMLTRRAFLSTSVVDGKIYATGGGNQSNDNIGNSWDGLSVVEEYDSATDTWTKKADMPTARWSLSTSVVDDKIYAIGGGHKQIPYDVVEEYDPATDTWTKKTKMPTARGGLATSIVNSKIYAIGGSGNVMFLSTVEEYAPFSSEKKSVELEGKLPNTWGKIKSN